MATLTGDLHGLKLNTESALRSPKSMTTTSSSEDLATNSSSPKSGQRPCLCSPTTHEGSFRCRLHRSPSGYWGKKPMPTTTPTAAANGVINRTDQSVEAQ
uniref:Serine-rich protein-like protein n=1 Tax=Picea sitchensis TaxID=3332 RepID=A9NY76_PICSI|nr:unknown [Picea sitchensis]